MEQSFSSTHCDLLASITTFQKINVESHNEMAKKITALEKWKWMLMGGGVLAGTVLEPLIYKMLGVWSLSK